MSDPTLQFGPTAGTTIRKDETVVADNRLVFNINNQDVLHVSNINNNIIGVTGDVDITGNYRINGIIQTFTGEINTASNVGTGGVGVFKQKDGDDLEFKNINSSTSYITITNDIANNEIDIGSNLTIDDITPTTLKGDLLVENGSNVVSFPLGVSGFILSVDDSTSSGLRWGNLSNLDIPHFTDFTNPHNVTIDQITTTTSKGDLLIENGSNVVSLSVGTDNQLLIADSGESSGIKWINQNSLDISDHNNLSNIGITYSHDDIDTHIDDGTIHFTEASINHDNITNNGTNTHSQIDTHISDTTIHFTQGSINHTLISNIGTNSHAQIDSHIADFNKLSGGNRQNLLDLMILKGV